VAKVRNISDDRRRVGYGFPVGRTIQPDEVLQLPDNELVIRAYVCQPSIWEPVDSLAQTALDNIWIYLESLEQCESPANPGPDSNRPDGAATDEADADDEEQE
jgi:hypothetical protein